MANLYEIDTKLINAIECGCDVETGEFIDEKGIEDLYMELNNKIEGIALYRKNTESDIEAIDKEIEALKKRKEIKQNKLKGLTNYLSSYLLSKDIKKFETPKVLIKFRKSTQVEILDESKLPQEFVRKIEKVEYKPDKKEIKNYLKTNPDKIIEGCRISNEDKDNYILNQYIEPFIVSKKFENKDYSVGDIIVESNRYDY